MEICDGGGGCGMLLVGIYAYVKPSRPWFRVIWLSYFPLMYVLIVFVVILYFIFMFTFIFIVP